MPLNVTAVAPLKPVPATVTGVPTGPEAGLRPLTVGGEGGAVTVKLEALVP